MKTLEDYVKTFMFALYGGMAVAIVLFIESTSNKLTGTDFNNSLVYALFCMFLFLVLFLIVGLKGEYLQSIEIKDEIKMDEETKFLIMGFILGMSISIVVFCFGMLL